MSKHEERSGRRDPSHEWNLFQVNGAARHVSSMDPANISSILYILQMWALRALRRKERERERERVRERERERESLQRFVVAFLRDILNYLCLCKHLVNT